ncbi:unnamed protein product [Mytilus coruscus]|uniref:Ig-like domain-containing protein n=1 Tax=Mytilus coruscus TaxID=42192 RepID=A0A6J8EMM1_MYTCO|nr:unnamed protein product [Mytilus coruscus]
MDVGNPEKNTNVEIACPIIATENDYVTWCFERSTIISNGKDVNLKFKTKYRVFNTSNLQICNFTYADEGRYTCQELIGKEIRQDTVIVTVCRISREERTLTKKSIRQLQKQVDVYTGDCASLKIKTNSKCDENIKIYLSNDMYKVLYLKNLNKTTAETFLCHIYKADNLEEITTAEHAG